MNIFLSVVTILSFCCCIFIVLLDDTLIFSDCAFIQIMNQQFFFHFSFLSLSVIVVGLQSFVFKAAVLHLI